MNNFLEYIKRMKAVFDKNFVSLKDGVLSQEEINALINPPEDNGGG